MLNSSACVEALVVPAPGGFLNLLKQEKEGCLVPWDRILRIGDDVILVELCEEDYHYLYYGYAYQDAYKPLNPN